MDFPENTAGRRAPAARRRRWIQVILVLGGLVVSFSLPFLTYLSWANHDVGNLKLEKTDIWEECCRDRDCVPQRVEIAGDEQKGKIPIAIEKLRILVKKGKFFPVPSPYTWVCYFDRNGELVDENIRCVLYPEKKGSVRRPAVNGDKLRAHTGPRIDSP